MLSQAFICSPKKVQRWHEVMKESVMNSFIQIFYCLPKYIQLTTHARIKFAIDLHKTILQWQRSAFLTSLNIHAIKQMTISDSFQFPHFKREILMDYLDTLNSHHPPLLLHYWSIHKLNLINEPFRLCKKEVGIACCSNHFISINIHSGLMYIDIMQTHQRSAPIMSYIIYPDGQ